MKKSLIVYYSRNGENYVNGNIIELNEGNTYHVARFIQQYTNGDMFEIKPIYDYSNNYNECKKQSKKELNNKTYPKLKQYPKNLDEYEVIYLGYPNWWGTYPMVVASFLKNAKLYHKTIVPFCSHEGSGFGRSIADIKQACPHNDVLKGFDIKGSQAEHSQFMVQQWLESIKEDI